MTKLALPLIFAFVVAGIVFMALLAPAKRSSCHSVSSCESTAGTGSLAVTNNTANSEYVCLTGVLHETKVKAETKANDSKTKNAPAASDITPVTDAAFQHEVLDSKGVVLVDFGATWCGPCRMMAPVVHKLDLDWHGKVKVLKMDVDESPASADRYGVRALPTFMVFKDGKPVERSVGMTSSENLQAMVQKYL